MRQETRTATDEIPRDGYPPNPTLEELACSYIKEGLDQKQDAIKIGLYQKAIDLFDVANIEILEGIMERIKSEFSFQEAETVLKLALQKFPKNARIRSDLGWLYYFNELYQDDHFNELYQDALEVFEETLRNDPNYPPAIHGRLAAHRMLRHFSEANKLVPDIAKRFPKHFGIQMELGWLYFDQKHYDKARQVFEEVFEKMFFDETNKRGDWSALKWTISCLRAQHRFPEAQDRIRRALQTVGEADVEIMNEQGWLHFDQKQYDRALQTFDKVLEKDSAHEFALQGKIASLRRQARYQEAQETFEKAYRFHKRSTGILSERGWLFIDQKQYRSAAEWFDDAVELIPDRIALRFRHIEALIAINHGHEAFEVLKELKKKFPSDIEVMERLGRFYLRRNDLKNAEKQFREILNIDRKSVLGLNGLAAVYYSQARYAEAAEKLGEVVQADPHNPVWYTNLARALARQENWRSRRWSFDALPFRDRTKNRSLSHLDLAEAYCKDALKIDQNNADAYGCLGIIAFKRGNHHEAEELLRNSIDLDPEEGSYRDLGTLCVITKRYEEAETMLKRALEINRDDALAYLELGYLYLQTEKFDKALQEFHQAMIIDPNNDEPPIAVATVLLRNQNFDEAENVLRKALEVLDKSRQWKIHLILSRLLVQKGDETEDINCYEEALVEARAAKRLKPGHPDPYYHIGIILAKQKDYRIALKYFRTCLVKDPQHDQAARNISRVRSHIRKERSGSHFWGGFCVGVLSLSQLILLWYFFSQNKVTATILSILIPVLLGLVVVGFLMPVLIKLKVAGLEVGFSDQKEPVYQGPKGGIGFSFAPTTIPSGPR